MSPDAEDTVELQRLAARYWALADLLEDVPLAELFEADAKLALGSLSLSGLPAIEGFFAERAAGMRETGRTTRHLAANFLARSESADCVRVRSTVLVYAGSGALPLEASAPSGIADFEDFCRRRPDGSWRYSSRVARTIFAGPNAAAFAR